MRRQGLRKGRIFKITPNESLQEKGSTRWSVALMTQWVLWSILRTKSEGIRIRGGSDIGFLGSSRLRETGLCNLSVTPGDRTAQRLQCRYLHGEEFRYPSCNNLWDSAEPMIYVGTLARLWTEGGWDKGLYLEACNEIILPYIIKIFMH